MATQALQLYVTHFDDLYREMVEIAGKGPYRNSVLITAKLGAEEAKIRRIAAYALASASGICLTDKDGTLPPALPAGLVKTARRHVYRVDPARRLPNRLKLGMVLAAKLALAAVVSAPIFLAWVALGCVVFGFITFWSTAWQLASDVASYPFHHPDQVHLVGVATFFVIIPGFWLSRLMRWLDQESKSPGTAPRPQGNFGSYAIKNFREESAYGDAQLARRDQIQRALRGHAVTDAPKFES